MTHTWVKHKDHGIPWRAPTEWLESFPDEAAGWERCEPPEEPNPAIAERVAWERGLAEQAAAVEAEKKPKSIKAASRGKTEE